mgnify:CR=1 FL=1
MEEKLSNAQKLSKHYPEEALLLCCCYIEAIGVRQYREIDYVVPPRKQILNFSKSKAFTEILTKYSGITFWDKIHPIGLLEYLPKSFNNNYQGFMLVLQRIGSELRESEYVIGQMKTEIENREQLEWLEKHIHKGSIGNIAYTKVRSELVHNITHQQISFRATWEGKRIPDIDFLLMHKCLKSIIHKLKNKSLEENTFWWEQ